MSKIEALILDSNKLSLGVPRFYFSTPDSISVPAASIYAGKHLFEWAEYDDEDNTTSLESDFFKMLSSGWTNTLCDYHLDIPIHIFCETEEVICYTTHIPENLVASDDASISIRIIYKSSRNVYSGCFATYKQIMKFWQMHQDITRKAKIEPSTQRYYFYNPNAYPTEYLDKAVIQSLFEYFSKNESNAHSAFKFIGKQ